MSIEQIQNERKRGRKWAKALAMSQIHTLVDAMVLGDFDWREWLDAKPSAVFLNAAFTEAQYREEEGFFAECA